MLSAQRDLCFFLLKMNSETNRLATFCNWPPEAPVNPIRIAKAGFFYTGQGTEVECFSCGGKISQWNYGDQAMLRHQRMQPNCRFVVNPEQADNEPLDLDRVLPQQTATAVLNVVDVSSFPLEPTPTEEDEMYRSDALRLLSFINWRVCIWLSYLSNYLINDMYEQTI